MKRNGSSEQQQADTGGWQVGDKIRGRYEIRDIKWGGMGVVYIALDPEWNTLFAIKTFQDEFLWNENVIDAFMSEAQTWVNLERHTNIVYANFVEEISGRPYVILEYIEGGDLSRYVGKLDIPHALDFAIQICNGMDYAYKQLGVIHRDIKPKNVMITREGVLKVTDSGLAKALRRSDLGEEVDVETRAASAGAGTSKYMPPEQSDRATKTQYSLKPTQVTTRSDIYSFGVTSHELLTGRLPSQSVKETFTEKPPSPVTFNSDVPSQLDSLIMKSLEKDPDDRYESFEELMGELVEIYDALPREQRVFGERYLVKGKKEHLTAIDWNSKGGSLGFLGRHQEAIACYDKALEINPRYAETWNNKGASLMHMGRHQEAIACYDKALEMNPRYAGVWTNKGSSLMHLERHQEAMACYDRALEIDERHALTWSNKGALLGELGKHQEAIVCYDKSLEIYPTYSDAWYDKGVSLGELERHQEAIACYDKALELEPKFTKAWINKGSSLGVLGRRQEAITCYEKFIELASPEYTSYVAQVEELIRQLRQEEVAEADFNLGLSPVQAGKREQANQAYGEAMVLGKATGTPEGQQVAAQAACNLGNNFDQVGKVGEANHAWQEAIALGKASGKSRARQTAFKAAFNLGVDLD